MLNWIDGSNDLELLGMLTVATAIVFMLWGYEVYGKSKNKTKKKITGSN